MFMLRFGHSNQKQLLNTSAKEENTASELSQLEVNNYVSVAISLYVDSDLDTRNVKYMRIERGREGEMGQAERHREKEKGEIM